MIFTMLKLFLSKYYDLFFLLLVIFPFLMVVIFKKIGQENLVSLIISKFLSLANRKPVLLLAFLLLGGFLVRLYKIDIPLADWHSFRQADTASVTRLYLENGVDLLHPKYHDVSRVQSGFFNPQGYRFVEFPLFNLIHTILFRSFPFFSLEVWGRLISVFSALFSSVLLFSIAKRFISPVGGLIAASFYLFLPYNIYFTRVILPEPLGIFFALSFIWFFVKFIDTEKVFYLFASTLFLAMSLIIKPYFVFYCVPIVFLLFQKYPKREIFRKNFFWFFVAIAFLPFILWRVWMLQYPEGIPFWKWTFNGDGIRFKPSFWYWIFGERLTKLILGYLGLVPFYFGLASNYKNKVFIVGFILGMLAYVSVFASANVRHDYYQSIAIPAVSLVFASGLVNLWNLRILNRKVAKVSAIISVIFMLVVGAYQVKEFYKINHPEIVIAGEAVDRLTPKDALVIADYNGDTAFLYQTKRRGWPVVELPIEELIKEGASYYVSVDLEDKKTKEFMEKFELVEKADNYVILKLRKNNDN